MRSDTEFVTAYRKALASVDPATDDMDIERVRLFAQTELCLTFIRRYLPNESFRTVPFLMMGYPKLLNSRGEAETAVVTLRHLCVRFGSVSAWLDATSQYLRAPEAIRCHDISSDQVTLRKAAPKILQQTAERGLGQAVPWARRTLRIADPGEAIVVADRGRTKLAYKVPAFPAAKRSAIEHILTPRSANPPIRVSFADLIAIAERVDAREANVDWPKESLPPLRLAERLKKLQPKGIDGFFDGGVFTLDGAMHVVGMLSSGKSTLVMALLMALTLGGSGKRIAMLVSDTMQAATLAARLRRHGVKATVAASLLNRARHLDTIYWQRGLDPTGWSIESLGDLSEGFSTACPLDGHQEDLEIVAGGADAKRHFPDFTEKQCHRLYQKAVPDPELDAQNPDDIGDGGNAKSCPLWTCCPAQEQQRGLVDAQVAIMTPQAFVHITPDKWTIDRHITIPELLQYTADLVIVDEVDGVQKVLDDIFAPRSPIMGDAREVYAPSIGLRSSEALREKSGAQFRKPVNTKWQSNFFAFFRLIGTIYAILQNERESLTSFYENTPFTAGSILYALWRRRFEGTGAPADKMTFDNPEYEKEFLEVIKVAGAISHYSRRSSISEDEAAEGDNGPTFSDARFRAAADELRRVANETLVVDYYDALVSEIEEKLDGTLKVFNAIRDAGAPRRRLDRRANALALILATVTDLALSHYNWLIKTQPAVARDFDIDEGHLLSRTNSLLKHYRTLLPANPAGAAFGLFYDEPPNEKSSAMGGKLTLITHLGVGRHLLTHLHDLLASQGQAGPHVLMLSGTSWAGGSSRQTNPKTGKPMDASSPSFDVQVSVKGVLIQPKAELEAIKHSVFALVNVPDRSGKQIRVSGLTQKNRRANLAAIAEWFAARRDGFNRFEADWRKMTDRWATWDSRALEDRRRALLVTNSYADAAVTAEALMTSLEANGYSDWKVCCVVPDRADDGSTDPDGIRLTLARRMPRSLIERFGNEPEKTILVAPVQIVGRGHNILNRSGKAAISAIYFMHRLHPRPDDLAPTIGRLNRFAQERFDKGIRIEDAKDEKMSARARRMRYAATSIVKYALEAGRFGYRSLPTEFKAQFAWDMLTPIWQTVGRGIRGGCPVFIGFVDHAFAPQSFEGAGSGDTPESSALVQCLRQLEQAMDPIRNQSEYEVARLLYEPFHDALANTEGLRLG